MNLFELSEICRDQLGVIKYLQGEHILHSNVDCAPCQHPYTLVKDKVKVSGYFWRGPPIPMKEYELDHVCLITHINNIHITLRRHSKHTVPLPNRYSLRLF